MRQAIFSLLRAGLLAALCMAFGACASGFDTRWQAAAKTALQDRYSGRWAGEWRSTRSGHHGALECLFSKESPGEYTADFHAHWGKMASSYAVPFKTHPAGSQMAFAGEHDLGPLFGGVYRYEGEVSATRFRATYESRYDGGVFELRRVPGK